MKEPKQKIYARPGHGQNGFVLVMVLWIMAAIALFAGSFAVWVNSAKNTLVLEKEKTEAEIDIAGTKATLLYLFGTHSMDHAGLTSSAFLSAENETATANRELFEAGTLSFKRGIALDDTVYTGLGSALFSVQDEGGLIGLANPSPVMVGNLLSMLGVPSEKTGPLVDKLLDYIDSDSLKRLNGAEADAYAAAGLPGPSNYLLYNTREVSAILGWNRQVNVLENDRFPRLTTLAAGGIPNFNTAPEAVLKSIPGIDAKTAEKILKARKKSPFVTLHALEQAAGKKLPMDPMEMRLFPSSSLRITLWHKTEPRYTELHFTLTTGFKTRGPWIIDHEVVAPMMKTIKAVHEKKPGFSLFTRQASSVQG